MNEVLMELARAIDANYYQHIGVRHCCEDEQVKVGDALRDSYNWDGESDVSMYFTTGETLDGACAIGLGEDFADFLSDSDIEGIAALLQSAYEAVSTYADNGGAIVLVVGEGSSTGTDDGEVIIRYPKALHIF